MKILKFGGTSLGNAERIRQATHIVTRATTDERGASIPVVVVVSAMTGVTDGLQAAASAAAHRDVSAATSRLCGDPVKDLAERRDRHPAAAYRELLEALWTRHTETAQELIQEDRSRVIETITGELEKLDSLLEATYLLGEASPATIDRVLTYGERLSALIFAATASDRGTSARFVDARRLLVTDDSFGQARVDFDATRDIIRSALDGSQRGDDQWEIPVVTGFTGATPDGRTTTLGRGGSDYTAAVLGAALDAEVIEIWTDVDGVMSTDPRVVDDAVLLPRLSYAELMELSHFGAKVVFPPTIHPAKSRGIPLVIRNTLNPDAEGTWIGDSAPADDVATLAPRRGDVAALAPLPGEVAIRGISSIHQVSLMRLEGDGMVGVPGIAGRLFGALARHGISVILISQASSEHSICFAVAPEDTAAARAAVGEEFDLERRLEMIDELIIEDDCSVIAAVGEQMCDRPGISGRLFGVLGRHGINVRAIAQGSSELNVSLVVDREDEHAALKAVHGVFFHPYRRRIRVAVAGTGQVGAALLEQFRRQATTLAESEGIELTLVAVANSRRLAADPDGIALEHWREALDAAPELEPDRLTELLSPQRGASGTLSPQRGASGVLCSTSGDARVFVDCTANAGVAGGYRELLEQRVAVVAANKLAFAGELSSYRELEQARDRHGGALLFEATVGAGLPVLRTLTDLRRTGHRIERIDGVLSGTCNAVLDRLSSGQTFSQAVRGAHADGLTEPHPYEDLSGGDVVRKLTILARLAGQSLEASDVIVEPLLAREPWSGMDLEDFWGALPTLDDEFAQRRSAATSAGARLRYVASLGPAGARVQLEAVAAGHPAFDLAGPGNLIAFTTQHYRDMPLVIRGPGAGPEVTASGVFADVLAAADHLEKARR